MRDDRSHPHPFKEDSRDEDGLFRLGFSRFFLLVDDEHAAPPPANANPRDLQDSALARYQLKKWRHLDVKDTATGEVERGPEKRNDDFGNGLMMCVHDGLPVAVPLSEAERRDFERPAGIRDEDLARARTNEESYRIITARWAFDSDREKERERERQGGISWFKPPRIPPLPRGPWGR